MVIFVDTSAIFASLDEDDLNHQKAIETWNDVLKGENLLVTTNYILVESFAIIQRRLGMESVRIFQEDILPMMNIEWIDELTHEAGISAFLTASRKNLSLVDCVSFEIMRKLGIKTAFAFDTHFSEQGFNCIP
jgi:predicted nucleic acid-binding protein